MGETKIIYHLDDQETPYLVKLPIAADRVTLADFKNALNKPNYTFFFKSMDDDFGVVKEEISDDNAKLPCFNGRVVSWLVSADGSHGGSDGGSMCADSQAELPPPLERTGGIGDSRPPSFHANAAGIQDNLDNETETESVVLLERERERERDRGRERERERPRRKEKDTHDHGGRLNGHTRPERETRRPELAGYESSSTLMSSELETTSFFNSEDDDASSRFSGSTEQSTSSRLMRRHRRRRRKLKAPRMERSSSFSSVTDSTMSLNIITVTLNMEKYNFLGISIVGQSNEKGDGGIYIGSIMKGGAVAADGRIEPGDMLLQVNDINFENMSNDDAVRVLREIVHKPGPITLTVAKCWDPNPRGFFTLPRSEPIRPIDPAAWVSHTAAMTGTYPVYGMSPSMTTITSTSSSITSSIPETERLDDFHLSIHSDMAAIAKAMANPESGLEVRDRMWLKITIPSAFIGSDVVDWLYHYVEGFTDRREARKYASNLLKAGYIRHTVNKITFSEQCYYIFGDLCGNMANLSLGDHDGSSGASDQDTLAPLPHPGAAPWPLAFPYQYPIPQPYNPHPLHEPPQSQPGRGGSAGSQHSEESRSSGSNCSGSKKEEAAGGAGGGAGGGESKSTGSGSESELRKENAPSDRSVVVPPNEHSMHSLISLAHSVHSTHSHSSSLVYGPPGLPAQPPSSLPITAPPGSPPGRDLASMPPELTASRQSFRMAMGNPSEFFVDVM
ncbi:segment polarity protein dishevelled homolog DVL-3 isoform X1 [Salmo salar]|uniref:Segment polarity protein dishevelled homolog DVL-3 isoform X1 n=2 Tax=Salmo salar TaxID=8030 RepID=A0A1S3SXB3_SALSA|nr:segment polarity protein dishevelled homolog DVL-3 isoform X1 [Salmo salar]|eukprot:XP_014068979.1 PREDICTED: segment polarity protein dishevelled homolog DVL-3-like isoform X1 [Salmo salar]